uniref:t-SNARE coiled-coil homology domain-containing protein n=1 Tax=Onchocerca volvulus TaxID=6282 RepID=A0A8R1TW86_ONCVO
MMAASTLLLSDFEHQYSVQTAEITARIGRLRDLNKNERVEGIHQIQRLLVDVENLLEQMELTVRELKPDLNILSICSAERSKYDLRVRSYRNDKKQLDAELDKAIQRLKDNADRDELMTFDNQISINQQDQLIENTERLERTSRRLQDTYRMVIETDQIGTEVLNDLSSQRETIMRARERMRQADRDLNRSHKMLSLMIRRLIQNRLLLLIIAVLLLFSLLFIIYKSL